MIKSPRFTQPRTRDYSSYHDHLRQYNHALQRQVTEALNDSLGENYDANFVLATTGSDGRLEKGPQSKIEIVVIGRGDYREKAKPALDLIQNGLDGGLFHPDLEFKTLDELFIAGYNGDIGKAYPTRVSDARFLYGNCGVLVGAYRQLFSELSMKEEGKSILDSMVYGRRRARQISETGKGLFKKQEITHFDLDEGVAFYDCEHVNSTHRGSFKFGPLRLVQYGLAVDLIRHIRDKNFDLDLLEHMPTNTVDRLNFFETEGRSGLSQEEIEDLSDCYKFFLHQYHLAQEAWRADKSNKTFFDRDEVKVRLDDVVRIVMSGRMVK